MNNINLHSYLSGAPLNVLYRYRGYRRFVLLYIIISMAVSYVQSEKVIKSMLLFLHESLLLFEYTICHICTCHRGVKTMDSKLRTICTALRANDSIRFIFHQRLSRSTTWLHIHSMNAHACVYACMEAWPHYCVYVSMYMRQSVHVREFPSKKKILRIKRVPRVTRCTMGFPASGLEWPAVMLWVERSALCQGPWAH